MTRLQSACRLAFRLLLLLLLGATTGAKAVTIDWQLNNRLRAFDYISAPGKSSVAASADLFERVAPRDGESSLDWIDRISAEGGSPYAKSDGPWIEDSENLDPRYKKGFVELPDQISISADLRLSAGDEDNSIHGTCEWLWNDSAIYTGACEAGLKRAQVQGPSGQLQVRRRLS